MALNFITISYKRFRIPLNERKLLMKEKYFFKNKIIQHMMKSKSFKYIYYLKYSTYDEELNELFFLHYELQEN